MVKRKMLAVHEDIAYEVVKAAKDRGETVYHYVNSILQKALDVERMYGHHPAKALDEYKVYSSLVSTGMILIPPDVLVNIKNISSDMWRDYGRRIARILIVKGVNDKTSVKRIIELTFKGVGDVSRVKNGSNTKFICTSSGPRDSVVEMLGYMIQGMLETIDSNIKVSVYKGLVVIEVPEN